MTIQVLPSHHQAELCNKQLLSI